MKNFANSFTKDGAAYHLYDVIISGNIFTPALL